MEKLISASEEELTEVTEVGPKGAASIVEFFSEAANREVIKKLRKAGVNPTEEKRAPKSNKLAGKTVVFTGGLERRSRGDCGGLGKKHCGSGGSFRKKRKG